mmetsp:Transcript_39714/g.64474  ORF Transcript_39714/g.64474 Transcript_39714/m.64474 type:complete len:104 (-) Transcript_39714:2785-3096(-)
MICRGEEGNGVCERKHKQDFFLFFSETKTPKSKTTIIENNSTPDQKKSRTLDKILERICNCRSCRGNFLSGEDGWGHGAERRAGLEFRGYCQGTCGGTGQGVV